MTPIINEHTLHRGAKYFMDVGRAPTHEVAMELLQQFGLTIYVGDEIATSADHQNALLTLVNVARRTLLGGVDIIGLPEAPCVTPLAAREPLHDAVARLGGRVVGEPHPAWPAALIGSVTVDTAGAPVWQLTWQGWRGGIIPAGYNDRLSERDANPLAPALAAAICAAEAFEYHAKDHAMAGRRSQGLSLWSPGRDWLAHDDTEPTVAFLPSRLWIIGLGNLGQAFAWLIGCLPYQAPNEVDIVLQDFDRIGPSNESTSVLSTSNHVGRKKARVVADWLEGRGFNTIIEERRFSGAMARTEDEPAVGLCGVDNANARAVLDKAGFGLVVEAGLGAGPEAFRSISLHTFPASRTPSDIWSKQIGQALKSVEHMPAYQALEQQGVDKCGVSRLASRTVGVPFVGVIAGVLVIAELLRRLHGGCALEVASLSVASLEDLEAFPMPAPTYRFGHTPAAQHA
jgi:hypothetical protein